VKVFGPKGSLLATGTELLFRDAKEGRQDPGLEGKPLAVSPLPRDLANPVSYFVDRIQKGKPIEDPVSGRLNVNVIAILDAARQSLESGRAEEIKQDSE